MPELGNVLVASLSTGQDLDDFDSKSANRAFATPRSWVFASDLPQDKAAEYAFDRWAESVVEGDTAHY